jgi:Ca-activated chloride channel family protein
VTDGYVTVELEAFDLIREHLNQMNVFSFGIGSSVNRFLIEGMARAGLGEAFVITEKAQAKAQAKTFREYIQAPVLTQISVEFDGFDAYDVEPVSIPDVLAERPVIVYGKWRGTPQGTITLNGYSGQGAYSQTIDVEAATPDDANAALRYLWARKRIELLGDYNTLYPSDTRVKEITQLGLKYNLLTKYTSFVAIDQIVRRDPEDPLKTVKQPVPLPKGVSPLAVGGGTMHSTPEPSAPLLLLIAALLIAFALRPESSTRKRRNEEVDELVS